MASPAPASAFARVAQFAADRRLHAAFQWLHLQEQQILRWQTELVAIAAPPFGEGPRAAWLCERFREAGLGNVHLDGAGNAIGILPGTDRRANCVLLSAHIDTVFPADTPINPILESTRLSAPGACDNGAGVVALLGLASALVHCGLQPECDLIFIGNVGEEGEGNLHGMRHIYRQAIWRDRIAAHVVLDGAGNDIAITHALGSQRYLVTLTGPGGHSWTDAGRANPIVVLSRAIARLAALELSDHPRTTFNVGTIEGGTAINAIPERASARFDIRSTDHEQLIHLEVELYRAIEDAVLEANRESAQLRRKTTKQAAELAQSIQKIGDRPAGRLAKDSRMMEALRAVDRHLGIRTEPRIASTDANIPLSLGVPAVTVGAGGSGGGIHTRAEWYDAQGRELGLRRILLLLLLLAS